MWVLWVLVGFLFLVVLVVVLVVAVKKQKGDPGDAPASEGRMNRDDEELLWSCSGATGPTCLLRLSLHQALLMEGLVYFLRGGRDGCRLIVTPSPLSSVV